MKFGKLNNIDNIDFSLKPDHPITTKLLNSLTANETTPQVYIGCTGWSMKEWIGKVYPKGAKTKDFLHYYSRQFNTIELNTTHYRTPGADTIKKWYHDTPADFRFCPKILQVISHSNELGFGTETLRQFCDAILGLEEKLGPCFMQLPPYFGYERLGLLERFLKSFPKGIKLAIELRHESCFGNPAKSLEIFELLQHYGAGLVITDVAGRRDVAHMGISAPFPLIRFVGNALHPTDYTRIDEWVTRIGQWFSQGLPEVFIFPHEPDNLLAPDLCQYLSQQVTGNIKANTPIIDLSRHSGGQQIELF